MFSFSELILEEELGVTAANDGARSIDLRCTDGLLWSDGLLSFPRTVCRPNCANSHIRPGKLNQAQEHEVGNNCEKFTSEIVGYKCLSDTEAGHKVLSGRSPQSSARDGGGKVPKCPSGSSAVQLVIGMTKQAEYFSHGKDCAQRVPHEEHVQNG